MLKLVDISYGGENGFNQAIELSAEVLSNVKFIQEKKLIGTSSFSYYSVSVHNIKSVIRTHIKCLINGLHHNCRNINVSLVVYNLYLGSFYNQRLRIDVASRTGLHIVCAIYSESLRTRAVFSNVG